MFSQINFSCWSFCEEEFTITGLGNLKTNDITTFFTGLFYLSPHHLPIFQKKKSKQINESFIKYLPVNWLFLAETGVWWCSLNCYLPWQINWWLSLCLLLVKILWDISEGVQVVWRQQIWECSLVLQLFTAWEGLVEEDLRGTNYDLLLPLAVKHWGCLSSCRAQLVLHLICRPKNTFNVVSCSYDGKKKYIFLKSQFTNFLFLSNGRPSQAMFLIKSVLQE